MAKRARNAQSAPELPGPAEAVCADPAAAVAVTGGVDTHRDFHWAAAKDTLGRVLGTQRFAASPTGYQALLSWLRSFGPVSAVGVEGTGSYGAGLTRVLLTQQVPVVEVTRPNRQKRRQKGKSDPQDAVNAAAAVQSGDATAAPKLRTGPIESVRTLRNTRATLIKARTAAWNTLHATLVTAPDQLREHLRGPRQRPARPGPGHPHRATRTRHHHRPLQPHHHHTRRPAHHPAHPHRTPHPHPARPRPRHHRPAPGHRR